MPRPHSAQKRKTAAGGRTSTYQHVSKGAIKRLARRGGVKRISALIYCQTRHMLKEYLKSLLKDACLYCEYSRRKTVSAADVVFAMKHRGQRLYGFDDPPFPVSIRSSIRLTSDTPSIPASSQSTPTYSTISSALENTEEQANRDSSDPDDNGQNSETSSRSSRRNLINVSRTPGGSVETEVGRDRRSSSHASVRNKGKTVRRSNRSRNECDLETTLGNIESVLGRDAENTGDQSDSDATVDNCEGTSRRSTRNLNVSHTPAEGAEAKAEKNRIIGARATVRDRLAVRKNGSNLLETAEDVVASTSGWNEENPGNPSAAVENLETENDNNTSPLNSHESDFDRYSFGMSPRTPFCDNSSHI